jgi:hypothetical protein
LELGGQAVLVVVEADDEAAVLAALAAAVNAVLRSRLRPPHQPIVPLPIGA